MPKKPFLTPLQRNRNFPCVSFFSLFLSLYLQKLIYPFILQSKHLPNFSRHIWYTCFESSLAHLPNRKRVVGKVSDCGRCTSEITIFVKCERVFECVQYIIIQSKIERRNKFTFSYLSIPWHIRRKCQCKRNQLIEISIAEVRWTSKCPIN